MTFIAVAGPLFVSVRVKVTVWPIPGEALSTVLVSVRFATVVAVGVAVIVGVAVGVMVAVAVTVAVGVAVGVGVLVAVGV
jgi:hypothetical protein